MGDNASKNDGTGLAGGRAAPGARRNLRGGLLARNALLSMVGGAAPILVGIFTIPYVVRGLGAGRFGILSIAWTLLAFVSLFDLGFGRATTKYVAECLGRGDDSEIPEWVWTSAGLEVLLGVAGAVVLAAVTPLLLNHVLRIPPSLLSEARLSFLLLAASVPVVLLTNDFRGILEAAQRFDLINCVRVPVNASIFLLPALAVTLGLRLPGIILLLVLARIGGALAYLALALRVFPALRGGFCISARRARPLASFGGWLTVSSLVSPILSYADRFFIGAMLSMSAVAYYSAPYEAVTRAGLVLAGSLAATIFPAFSSWEAAGERERITDLYVRSLKLLVIALGPALLLVSAFAHPILRLWLGAEFAAKGSSVLQILAIGVLANSLGTPAYQLVQAVGRPDLTAKFHLLELPAYAGILWYLTGRMGISGVALAWTLRSAADTLLLFGACASLRIVPLRALADRRLLTATLEAAGLAAFLAILPLSRASLATEAESASAGLLLFAALGWALALDEADKDLLICAAGRVAAVGRGKR